MTGTILLQQSRDPCWLYFHDPIEIVTTTDPAQVRALLTQIEQQVERRGLHAAGFITYEAAPAFDPALRVHWPAGLPLLWFGLYREPETWDRLKLEATAYHLSSWQPAVSREHYDQAIDRIKGYIRRGESYQVNYTMRLHATFSGDPLGLFNRLAESQRGNYAAYIDTGPAAICSASPELFFRRDGTALVAKPMKGTAARGKTLGEDARQIDRLRRSIKNRAENVMIVDMIRNDLGRIAQAGSVRVPHLFEVERYPTVLQMTSTVTAQTSAATADIIAALFPCASITGAPKVRTMAIINQLEPEPRGIYTGCIGYLAPNRQAQFNVAIRTVAIDNASGVAEYGVGGGIVWDSRSGPEYEECQLKARVLTTRRPPFDLLETILWEPGSGYFLLAEHLERLAGSAHYFDIPLDYAQLWEQLAAQAATLDRPHRIRLLAAPNGRIKTQAVPFNPQSARKPWQVALAAGPVDSNDIFLYHKTTHRQMYADARAARPGFDDVILWNERGEITESTIANVIIQRGDALFTPPVTCGLLAGVFRRHLLAHNKIREAVITVDKLKASDRVYLINSVRRWVPASLVA